MEIVPFFVLFLLCHFNIRLIQSLISARIRHIALARLLSRYRFISNENTAKKWFNCDSVSSPWYSHTIDNTITILFTISKKNKQSNNRFVVKCVWFVVRLFSWLVFDCVSGVMNAWNLGLMPFHFASILSEFSLVWLSIWCRRWYFASNT